MILIISFLVLLFSFLLESSDAKINPIIVGGGYTTIEKYPHAVKLLIIYKNKPEDNFQKHHQCGGSILNEFMILTAAHCVLHDPIVYVGVGHEVMFSCKYYPASSTIAHEDYGGAPNGPVSNDIGLIKLKNPLKFHKSVRSIKIMRSPPYNKLASVAGWGMVDGERNLASQLKHLTGLKVWSRKQCVKRFNEPLPKGVMCAGYTGDINDTINGADSGSGLIVKGNILTGIVSFRSELSQVYTDVAHFFEWIQRNVKKLYRKKHKRILPF